MLNVRVGRLICRAWTDQGFRQLLLTEPGAAFALFDIPVPPGVELRVFFDSENVSTFVIPAPPLPPEP